MTCPDLAQIELYLAGTLPGSERSSILEHLNSCARCRGMVDEITRNLALLERVRGASRKISESHNPGDTRKFAGYRLIRELGRGGMGVVYLAEQAHPARLVALKLVPPTLSTPTLLQRFRQEVQFLGSLKHPGIAGIYEAGVGESEDPGGFAEQPYFAMEYLQGPRLDEFIKAEKPSTPVRLHLLTLICDAVHHAHTRGIIHRDLKPGNIIIEGICDESGESRLQPKVLDFGVARSLDTDWHTLNTNTGGHQLLGTIPFMSPEQVAGDPGGIDTRSDIYSIGVLGYWMLTGALPYDLQNRPIPEAARIIRDEEPTPASSHDASLRGDVEIIFAKAIAKDPDRRYASAAEMAEDIRRHLRYDPINARSPSAWYQLSRFTRRNRALTVSIAALFLVTLVGGILATVLAIRSNRAEKRAGEEAATAISTNEFLLKVLSSADPYAEWGGRDITVAAALDIAAAQLDSGGLGGKPKTELAVRHTVGNAYRTLGNYPAAQHQLERGLFAHDSAFGSLDPAAVSARNDLAAVLAEQGDFTNAVNVARMSFAAAHAAQNLEDETQALGNLAAFLAEQGRYREAESTIVENVAVLRELHGSANSEVAINLNNLGVLRARLGQYDAAKLALVEALDIQKGLAGERHPLTITIQHSLARTLAEEGNVTESVPLLRHVLEIQESVLGAEHPDMPAIQTSLALGIMRAGNLEEADSLLCRALTSSRSLMGGTHPTTARVLATLGELRAREGRFAAADSAYVLAESAFRDLLGDHHPFVAAVLHERGVISEHSGHLKQAEAQFAEALQIRNLRLGSDNPLTLETGRRLTVRRKERGQSLPDSLNPL